MSDQPTDSGPRATVAAAAGAGQLPTLADQLADTGRYLQQAQAVLGRHVQPAVTSPFMSAYLADIRHHVDRALLLTRWAAELYADSQDHPQADVTAGEACAPGSAAAPVKAVSESTGPVASGSGAGAQLPT